MIRLKDDEFIQLCDFMKTKYGINLSKKRILIEYRLMNTLNNEHISSYSQYLRLLKKDTGGKLEEELVNRLTTNYTFFMREPSHFQFIEEHILPEADMHAPYHIWIAGCSSGQECYTLIMRLEDQRKRGVKLPEITITATDISIKALQEAQQGEYPVEALGVLPRHWKHAYCQVHEERKTFTIRPFVKKQVKFVHHNLMEPYHRNYFQLILCRNVLIYFDEVSRLRIYENFASSLKNRGYLILGHAEMIPQGHPSYEYLKSSVYRLKERQPYG